jgi:hypothetical protein
MQLSARAGDELQCNKSRFSFESARCGHCLCALRRDHSRPLCALRRTHLRHAALETPRANIQRGAGKDCSGRRTMDLFVVVIIAAMLFTVATVLLGVFTMSVGGSTNKTLSTPLMWARVGFQALTILLLFAAIRLR